MWGHYSDGGKGIAIGFNVQYNSSITSDSLCLKVKYKDDLLVLKDKIKTTLAITIGDNGQPLYSQAPAFDDLFY